MNSDFSLLSDLFENTSSRQKFVDKAVDVLRAFTSCECVGIRVLNSDGTLPYQSYVGFSHDFWVDENCLSLNDECVCTRAIKESTKPVDQAILSEGGSVCSNELQAFSNSLPEHLQDWYRGKCIASGFESLGVVILKGNQEAVGMLHLADTRSGMFPPEKMKALESLSNVIGAVILRFRTEDELRSAIETAEEASKSKSEFLANMSHEIRTPLNGMFGMLELIRETATCPEQNEYADIALDSGRKLLTVLNDILDLSRIEAGRMPLQSELYTPAATVQTVKSIFDKTAEKKGIDLSVALDSSVPSRVCGDEGRLRQILFNLIGNAIKFTETGFIRITCTGSSAEAEGTRFCLHFTVSDSGLGIEREKLQDIFKPFTQADGTYTRRFGGSGLGLSIVKRLVTLMGGDVEIESEPGKGTVIRFTVMTEAAENLEVPAESDHLTVLPFSDRRLNILVAEDEPTNQLMIKRLIEKRGHRVTTVSDGQSCIQALASEDFDLIFMDVQMPKMDGMQATRKIRRLEDTGKASIPIVALTAHAMKGDREKFMAAGMDEYLSKPLDSSTLDQMIGEFKVEPESVSKRPKKKARAWIE